MNSERPIVSLCKDDLLFEGKYLSDGCDSFSLASEPGHQCGRWKEDYAQKTELKGQEFLLALYSHREG